MRISTFLVISVVVAATLVTLYGRQAIALVRDAYPSDPARAEALNRCAAGDPHFIRFSERERDGCYAHFPNGMAGLRR